MADKTDVLICGAGAAGLALAIELARRGVAFRLVDMLDTPFPGSRGKGIQPRTQEIFEGLGVLDRLVATGGMYPPARVYREDGSWSQADIAAGSTAPTPDEPYRLPLMVPQFLTEAVLRERLAALGHRPEYGHRLVRLEQDADTVTATIAAAGAEQVLQARYLVGTDGGRSFVRHALGIDFPGKTLDVRAMVADVQLEGLDRSAWHQFNPGSMERMFWVCPLAGTDLFQLQAPIPLEGEFDLSRESLQAMTRERSGRDDIIIGQVHWASAYHMNARLAERYRDGRVFLAGDAAHIHPPTGGQGLNTSVQDAFNLGWKLAAVLAGAAETLLDSYEEERRPIAASMLGLSTRLLDDAKRGELRRSREVSQLDLGYRQSPLSLPAPARNDGPMPGDRAPDAPMQGAAGQPRRLFELLAGPHWTAVGYHAAWADLPARAGLHVHLVGPGGDLLDGAGHFRQAYAPADGDWILVRPDGYIAAVVPGGELATLQRYLDAALGASE